MTSLPPNWTAVLDQVERALAHAEEQAIVREKQAAELASTPEPSLSAEPAWPSLETLTNLKNLMETAVRTADEPLAQDEKGLVEWLEKARTGTQRLADLHPGSL